MNLGLAKALFEKKYSCSPWNKRKTHSLDRWPLVHNFLANKQLSYFDYLLTQRILDKYDNLSQEVAFFISHLIKATKEGHLCVCVSDHQIVPDIQQLWQSSENSFIASEEVQKLNDLLRRGLQQLPCELIYEMKNDLDDRFLTAPLYRYKNRIYLQKYWIFESTLLKFLKIHIDHEVLPSLDLDRVLASIQKMSEEGLLLEEQAQAIQHACQSSFSIITGGPGTGKSYTAIQLIRILWENLSAHQRSHYQIALVAPTGKAVANLQKNLAAVQQELQECPIVVKTLHSLLKIRSSAAIFNEAPFRLSADLIIVDESSMIDVQLMSRLFASIKPGARVVLLGDPHQLPAVEAGSVFADLIDLANNQEKHFFSCTQLRQCLRTELRSIVTFADWIKQGEADKVLNALKDSKLPGIKGWNLPLEKKEEQMLFLDRVKDYFPCWIKHEVDDRLLLDLFHSIRILSPLRKGLFGVGALNALFWSYFSQCSHTEGWLVIPIIIIANDYQKDLFNGETGVLLQKLPLGDSSAKSYALFSSRQGDQSVRKIQAALLPRYEYAFCLSVHKSQGSEFDRIVLVMPSGSELFGREVFYTAVTRARKEIQIYGSCDTLSNTISQKGVRLSGVSERMQDQN